MTDLYQSSITFSSADDTAVSSASSLPANKVHAELRRIADSNFAQGKLFERVMCKYFMQAPLYRDNLKSVRLWDDWANEHGIDGRDTGIDLVADTVDGNHWAIQCKCYAETHVLQKRNIDSFLSSTGKIWGDEQITFSEALIVSTTPRWSIHAENAIAGRTPPCIRLDLTELTEDEGVDWSSLLPDLDLEPPAPRQLRLHQEEAVDDVLLGFTEADRGQLIMACGTGKTYTALKIAERQVGAGGRVLFLVPSLSLLSQTLREWAAHHDWDGIRTFAVCSDSKVGRTNEDINAYDMAIPPTTDGRMLADGLSSDLPTGHAQLVFATYHSIGVVHDAQKGGAPAFNLVICDEAHRTTGVDLKDKEASYYTRVHDEKYLKADKRLYMTATPRIYKDSAKRRAREEDQVARLYSMDEKDYGKTLHRLDFSDAVAMDLLSDYKVLVLMVNQRHANESVQSILAMMEKTNLNDAAKIIGCWNGLSKRITDEDAQALTDLSPMRRAVAFCQSIDMSKNVVEQSFSGIVQKYLESYPEDEEALGCTVRHVDGTQNALKRNQALQWLRDEPDENECRILSNVRCLSEGVDVPALDAVLFLSPRNSQVDVVQAVGRVMRKAEGKDYGYVILPVCVDEKKSPEEALQDDKTYKVVWQVLQALRAHDNRFNAEVNRIELNKRREGRINVIGVGFGEPEGGEGNGISEPEPPRPTIQLPFDLRDWKEALYARLVLKCGDRRYWETWAKDVVEIASRNITRITSLVDESEGPYRDIFDEFLTELKQNINPEVEKDDAIEMLAQHLITRPVFDALFEGYSFIGNNPVSKTMQTVLECLQEQKLVAEAASLEAFYDSVRRRAAGIDNAEGRQKVVIELYEKFFKEAFPSMAERLGIVYTPVESVDFILHSVNDLLVQEFGENFSSQNVHVLDPFTGTGTFLTRLLASGLITDSALERKYRQELHANEIVLLAYYIAAVNIEETYHERLKAKMRKEGKEDDVEYESFPGIVLTDTFQINERDGDMLDKVFPVNSKRVLRQKETPIRVVLGNPPYSAKQSSGNDNNANLRYPKLDANITGSYAEHSTATLKNSLYDSYIRAFRWASDRIGDEGIVGYVSNGGWLDGNAMDGFRRCMADEFDRIYCFNLRGNQRTSGELSRKEGGKIFGSGSRAGITLTFLVKKKDAKGECEIRYRDIGDGLDRQQKLDTIRGFCSIGNMENLWETITPNKYHDWINQRNETFLSYLPLGDKESKRNKRTGNCVFALYSRGVATSRDAWAYNFSQTALAENMQKTITFYNSEVERYQLACKGKSDDNKPVVGDFLNYDSTQIHWDRANKKEVTQNKTSAFNPGSLRAGLYRPFCKQGLYFNRQWNNDRYQQPRIFPKPDSANLAICVPGIGSDKEFSALMVNTVPDLNFQAAGGQCFPRYHYLSAGAQGNQVPLEMGEVGQTQVDNIPQETVDRFREKFRDSTIDADAIFYYVYGLLHSPDYKTRFAADLKKMLPRIPLVASSDDFQRFSEAGRVLAGLHVDYEDKEVWPMNIYIDDNKKEEQTGQAEQDCPNEEALYRVKKMAFGGTARSPDKTTIRYNSHITIQGIPLDAYRYIVNGKSAIEWIIERYQVKQHKDSRIINDPNDWSDDPRYILELLGKVVSVSMNTVEIVDQLPKLETLSHNLDD